jgi:hypothetical protein
VLVRAILVATKEVSENLPDKWAVSQEIMRVTSKVEGLGIFFWLHPLAQTWHARPEFQELRFSNTMGAKLHSRRVAPGPALAQSRLPDVGQGWRAGPLIETM